VAQGKERRARSRKRRSARGRSRSPAPRASQPPPDVEASSDAWRAGVQDARRRPRESRPATEPVRPRPPWHPLPLAEILILAGAVALVVGLGRGPDTGGRTPLLLGVAAVGIGTIEFSLREHRSGFRSHTILLALLPVVVFHTLVVLVVSAFTPVTRVITFATLVADVAVFSFAVRLLRLRLREARHERASGLRRDRR
jgi:hypothetical protein